MSRRPRTPPAEPADKHAGDGRPCRPASGNTPFAGLRRQLQDDKGGMPASPLQPSPGKRIRPSPVADDAKAATPGTQPPDEAELALFRKTVGAAAPVRDGNRAEIERARPAPLPRPRSPQQDEESIGPGAPAARLDPLSLAYEGVVPLRATGRIELDTPLRHGMRTPAADKARAARPDGLVLPADAGNGDPASLFHSMVADVRPIDPRNRVELQRPAPRPAPIKREEDERAALGESLAAPLSFEDRLDMGEEAAFLRPGLPRRILTDLRRGRWVLQGQLDLHGLVRDEARDALARFLSDSLLQGKRCIRVIHGKGHGSPGKVSILKQLSRGWLAQREEILAFCQAGPHDGGGGALLVLLRAQNGARS
ncbi:Smr/MutS family protein [Thauera butanivorans]|uniref:Smr/MutS family protein n=1 Tax=Thauera butanivorans TaxID=86174 RepID=UPI003AB49ABA